MKPGDLVVLTLGLGAAAALSMAVVLTWTEEAQPHDALPTAAQPEGWTYQLSCCSVADCRRVPDSAIHEGPDGYTIRATGELIPYNDKRIRDSKDQFYHWCSEGGAPDSKTICLYRAPRGF